ncbi:hypothetical protein [Mesobacillus jeotgali]|uniref:hypothetical protein n=1 Tax=Mesobacillus jeotgali TaxID=129985 RepID=UPI0009A8F9FA|nr:hypothetical protein [Mesobacillus jeotgali]
MTEIKFKNLHINIIANSSGVYNGSNLQHNWRKRSSSSDGFGLIEGKLNKISKNITVSNRRTGDPENG